jgi:hypothetical protein
VVLLWQRMDQKIQSGRQFFHVTLLQDYLKFELEEIRLERSRKLGRKVTSQEILAEAYNDLFKKYGRAELAPMSGD